MKEVDVWKKLSHPYILPLYGIFQSQGQSYLVAPFQENGALPGYLEKFPQANRKRMVRGISLLVLSEQLSSI